MNTEYFKQGLTSNTHFKDISGKIETFKETDPVKLAFASGFGSGFLIGCTVGLRNLFLLGIGSVTTYYCYTNYGT